MTSDTKEFQRLLASDRKEEHWKRWGPYLSERQWATVREDYSENMDAWSSFPFEHSHQRAYRWGEDGLAGISDNHQRLCLSLALWNGRDYILKERLFGLTNHQGNHGEDVKELYYYADATPSHSYLKWQYKYPFEYPYQQIIQETKKRGRKQKEYEITDTKVFERGYFDCIVEYSKKGPEDIFIKVSVTNRSASSEKVNVIPQGFFRNTWSWGTSNRSAKPESIECPKFTMHEEGEGSIKASHETLGEYYIHFESEKKPKIIFTENNTNKKALYGQGNETEYVKDGFHEFIIKQNGKAVNHEAGTKVGIVYEAFLEANETAVFNLLLTTNPEHKVLYELGENMRLRISEADEFYHSITNHVSSELQNIQRQAFAGLLWSQQYYYFNVQDWLDGDPNQIKPPPNRCNANKNKEWRHLNAEDVMVMPDKWEYPFFATWDSSFQAIPLAIVDPFLAKKQLLLLTREWLMHPNGQLPAYEWNFNDVNPPVHAWATYRVFKMEKKLYTADYSFLERVFQKLLLNFTWWVNRKDVDGLNIFEGGFLGLDNISLFNRSEPIPFGGKLRQADATSWMAMYALNMLKIAIELAQHNSSYEDIASKFFEHFLYISDALSYTNDDGKTQALWDPVDGFYYDCLIYPDGKWNHLKVRSLVGLIPLNACLVLDPSVLLALPDFKRRMDWFLSHRQDLMRNIASMTTPGEGQRILLSLVNQERLTKILSRLLDPEEFLSPYGFRSLSRHHKDNPYVFYHHNQKRCIKYESAESTTGMFGGNSNWRGAIWIATNFLLCESLQRFNYYYGQDFKVEFPTGSGKLFNLDEIANFVMKRLISIFSKDETGVRPLDRGNIDEGLAKKTDFSDLVLFYEYFDGDTARGLGASHQTGWTALVAKMIHRLK